MLSGNQFLDMHPKDDQKSSNWLFAKDRHFPPIFSKMWLAPNYSKLLTSIIPTICTYKTTPNWIYASHSIVEGNRDCRFEIRRRVWQSNLRRISVIKWLFCWNSTIPDDDFFNAFPYTDASVTNFEYPR